MSYILDALKKADAERERTAVPGLHAHPQDGVAANGDRRLLWPLLAVAAIVLLGGSLAWLLLSDRAVRTPPLVARAPAEPVAPAPTRAPQPRALQPAPADTPAIESPPAHSTGTPAPTAPAPAPPPVVAEPAPTPVVVRPPPPAPTPVPAATAAPAATPARVPALAELPAEVRAGVPPLSISGAVVSPTPSARLLFVNGQVLREGDAVADGLTIERIGASSSVLSLRGQRFEVRH